MTDGDRALASKRRRTPALGVPVPSYSHDPEDFTPVGDILPAVGPEQQTLLAIVWRHTANMELRLRQAIGATDAETVRAEVAALDQDLAKLRNEHTAAVTDLRGERGDNGKVGELKRRVDGHASRAWWFTTFVLGLAGAAVMKVATVVTAFNAVAATAAQSRDEIRILQAQVQTLQSALLVRDSMPDRDSMPAPGPGKDQP